MSRTTDDRRTEGVEFSYEDDLVTAHDIETGVAASGGSKSEALAELSDALALHEGDGEPITDESDFLREVGIDPAVTDEDERTPPWLE